MKVTNAYTTPYGYGYSYNIAGKAKHIDRKNCHFTSYHREVYSDEDVLLYRNNTYFFRQSFEWSNFAKFLEEKYKNENSINIVSHACSVGEETYTLMLALLSQLGKKDSKKFFPIHARDIDNLVIALAKNPTYMVYTSELRSMARQNTLETFEKYFNTTLYDINDVYETNGGVFSSPGRRAKKKVEFEVGNIFDDMDLISKDNTVLMLRNMWFYQSPADADRLAKMLAANMKGNSLLVIAREDCMHANADLLLKKYGFKPTKVKYVFEAPGKIVFNENVTRDWVLPNFVLTPDC